MIVDFNLSFLTFFGRETCGKTTQRYFNGGKVMAIVEKSFSHRAHRVHRENLQPPPILCDLCVLCGLKTGVRGEFTKIKRPHALRAEVFRGTTLVPPRGLSKL